MILSLLLCWLFYIYWPDFKWNKPRIWLPTFIIIILYSVALVYFFNCLYDPSRPEVFKTKVYDKLCEGFERGPYPVSVLAWGTYIELVEIHLSGDDYDNISKGDAIYIFQKEGLLYIPWFHTSLKAPSDEIVQ